MSDFVSFATSVLIDDLRTGALATGLILKWFLATGSSNLRYGRGSLSHVHCRYSLPSLACRKCPAQSSGDDGRDLRCDFRDLRFVRASDRFSGSSLNPPTFAPRPTFVRALVRHR